MAAARASAVSRMQLRPRATDAAPCRSTRARRAEPVDSPKRSKRGKRTAFAVSPQQLQFYRDKGYLVLEDFAEPELCDAMKTRAEEIVRDFGLSQSSSRKSVFSTKEQERTSDDYFLSSGDKIHCFFEAGALDKQGNLLPGVDIEKAINKIGHALQEKEPVFRQFANSAKMKALADALEYRDCRLLQGMYIFKQPRIGGEVAPHQDSTFLFTEPPSTHGLWLAVEDATLENGCLWVVPGSHRIEVRRRFMRNANGRGTVFDPPEDTAPLPTEGAISLPARKGTAVLLHGQLVHFSFENKSDRSRHAFTVHMVDGSCDYPASNWLQGESKSWEPMRLTGEG